MSRFDPIITQIRGANEVEWTEALNERQVRFWTYLTSGFIAMFFGAFYLSVRVLWTVGLYSDILLGSLTGLAWALTLWWLAEEKE